MTALGSTTNSTSTRTFGPNTTFNGPAAMQVIDRSSTGSTSIQFIQDTAAESFSLGNRAVSGGTTIDLINQPPVRNAKAWTAGQTRSYAFSVVGGPSGTNDTTSVAGFTISSNFTNTLRSVQ